MEYKGLRHLLQPLFPDSDLITYKDCISHEDAVRLVFTLLILAQSSCYHDSDTLPSTYERKFVMAASSTSDIRLMHIMKKDPQEGMRLLLEQYTGLVWHIISAHLNNPEDIRECVSETFSQFYFRREKYNPQKASLSLYLAAIARRIAVSRYRKEKRYHSGLQTRHSSGPPEISVSDSIDASEHREYSRAELKADLEQAMKELRPDELEIIRMKYYDGMTIREIAASLNLPYETVKKRHHRSLGKLRRTLILTLVIIALLLLTACTYSVLRYYEIVPDLWEILIEGNSDESPEDEVAPLTIPDPSDSSGGRDSSLSGRPDEDGSREEENLSSLSGSGTDTEGADTDGTDALAADASEDSMSSDQQAGWLDGFGIVSDAQGNAYALTEPVEFETEGMSGTVESAVYADNTLYATVMIRTEEGSFMDLAQEYIPGQTAFYILPDFSSLYQNERLLTSEGEHYNGMWGMDYQRVDYIYEDVELEEDNSGEIELTLVSEMAQNAPIPDVVPYEEAVTFSMEPAAVEGLENRLYRIDDSYGIITSARRDADGSLIVSIWPLSPAKGPQIMNALVRGPYAYSQGDVVTVIDKNGNEYAGECLKYSPDSDIKYFEWNFGQVPEGEYTLHIPCLFLRTSLPEEFYIPLDLVNCTWDDTEYPVYGGSLAVESITLLDSVPGERIDGAWHIASPCADTRYWKVCLRQTMDDPAFDLVALRPYCNWEYKDGGQEYLCVTGMPTVSDNIFKEDDPEMIELMVQVDTAVFRQSGIEISSTHHFNLEGTDIFYNTNEEQVCLRWNLPIDIPLDIDSSDSGSENEDSDRSSDDATAPVP